MKLLLYNVYLKKTTIKYEFQQKVIITTQGQFGLVSSLKATIKIISQR